MSAAIILKKEAEELKDQYKKLMIDCLDPVPRKLKAQIAQSRSIVLDSIDPPHELASIKKDLSKLLDTKQIQCLTIKKAREKLTALSLNQAFDLGHKKEEIILGVSLDFQKKLISADIPKKIKILLQKIEE